MTIVTQNCQGMFLNLVVIIMAFLNLLIFILNDGYIMYGDHIFEITGEEFKILDDTGLPTENTLFHLFCHFSFIYDSLCSCKPIAKKSDKLLDRDICV